MASGRLGVADVAANADTTVYTVPSGKIASCNVAVVNRGSASVNVNVAFSLTGTPLLSEYLEYQTLLPPNGVLERTAIVATSGERVVIRCTSANCSVRVHGYEENE